MLNKETQKKIQHKSIIKVIIKKKKKLYIYLNLNEGKSHNFQQ